MANPVDKSITKNTFLVGRPMQNSLGKEISMVHSWLITLEAVRFIRSAMILLHRIDGAGAKGRSLTKTVDFAKVYYH